MNESATVSVYQWLTYQEAADCIKVHKVTLQRWIKDGRIKEKYLRRFGDKVIRISAEWLNEGAETDGHGGEI
ncbi:helix-turn-helix domain-containing protein [Treponema primitia]|uniref:helix-turn-helix domain-containing protein n=1 Tax=Treponema primitia TaxID=88058 RepID=UPI003980897C